MKKIFIFDFDGTLTTQDMLDEVCDIVGKKKESKKINDEVINGRKDGVITALCARVNFLKGVTNKEIEKKLGKKNYLRNGVVELFKVLNEKGYITIVSSGSILPVLKYYQELLNITYVFGSDPDIVDGVITGINESKYKSENFKYENCLNIIEKFKDDEKIIYGIGDSAVDIKMLSLADKKFAIDPKGNLDKHVDHIINDISDLIEYLD